MVSSAVTLALLGAVSMAAGAPSTCKCPSSAKMLPCEKMATGTAIVKAKIQDAKPSATSVAFTATVQDVFKGKVAANTTISFSATPATFQCGVSQPLPGQELVLTLSGTGPFTMDDCGLNAGWASLTPELRRALSRTPTTAYDCALSKGCTLGKTTVADGWEGNGVGDQSCNKCACVNGDLNCSGAPCNGTAAPPLQPKKVSVGSMQVSETTARLLSNPKLQGAIIRILTPEQRAKLPANIMGQVKAGKADPSLVLQILAMIPPTQLKELTKPQPAIPSTQTTTAAAATSSPAPTSLTAVPSAPVAVNPVLLEALKNPQVLLFLSQSLPPTVLASISSDALTQLTSGTATPTTLTTIAALIPADLQQKIIDMVSKPSSAAPAPTTTAAASSASVPAPSATSMAHVAPSGSDVPSGSVSSLPAAEVSEISEELNEIAKETFSASGSVTVFVPTGTSAAAGPTATAAPVVSSTAAPAAPVLTEQQLAALALPSSQKTLAAMLPAEVLSLIPAPVVTALKAGTATAEQIEVMVAALPPPVIQAMASMLAAPAPAPTTAASPAPAPTKSNEEESTPAAAPSAVQTTTSAAAPAPKVTLTPEQFAALAQPKTQQTLMSLLPPALLASIPAEDQADLKAGTATPAELEELVTALPAEVLSSLLRFLDAIAAQQPTQSSSHVSASPASTTAQASASARATEEPSATVVLPTLPASEVAEVKKELEDLASETFSSADLPSTTAAVPVPTSTTVTLTAAQFAMLADPGTQVTVAELLPQEVVALLPEGAKDVLVSGKATTEQLTAIVAALPAQVVAQLAAFLKPPAATTTAAPAPATSAAAPAPAPAPTLTAEQFAALADPDVQKTIASLLPAEATKDVPAEIMTALQAGALPAAQLPAFVAALPAQIVTQMAPMLKAPAPAPAPAPVSSAAPAPVESAAAPTPVKSETAATVAPAQAPAPAPTLTAEQFAALADPDVQKTIASLLPAEATKNVPAEIMTALKAGALPAAQLPAFVAALPAQVVTQMAPMLKAPAPAPAPAPVSSAAPAPVESAEAPAPVESKEASPAAPAPAPAPVVTAPVESKEASPAAPAPAPAPVVTAPVESEAAPTASTAPEASLAEPAAAPSATA